MNPRIRTSPAITGSTLRGDGQFDSVDNAEAVDRITDGFARRVSKAVGAGYWTVEVRNRAHHQVAYHLVHFSRHRDGLWLFGEAVSLAQEAWRRACLPPAQDGTLFDAADTFEQEEKERAETWITTIQQNVLRILQEHGAFTIEECPSQVLAGVLGQARQKHIRAAIKGLHKEGKTTCTGVGDVRSLRVPPTDVVGVRP